MLFLKLTRRLKKLFNRQRDWPSNDHYPVVTALGNEVTGAVWQHGVAAEIAFWNQWLATRGGQWPADFSFRTTPTAPLQPHVLAALPSSLGVTVHILDVGAGPLTYLGKQWAGHCLQITAIDPLAAEYDQLLQRYQLTPLVRTQQGFAEHLLDQFGGDRFDLVHARNSIDHSYDPGANGCGHQTRGRGLYAPCSQRGPGPTFSRLPSMEFVQPRWRLVCRQRHPNDQCQPTSQAGCRRRKSTL